MSCNFENLTAKIFIKKNHLFGLRKKYAIIVIVPSMVIAKIVTNIKNLPLKKLDFLDMDFFMEFVKKEKFTITYTTQHNKLKKKLNQHIHNLK
jgi:hypothetical protein